MAKKKGGRWLIVLIIILIIVAGWFFLNKKTSMTFEEICNEAGWKATSQTYAETGEPAIMCWKAEDPAVVKDSFNYDCGNGNQVVYYYVTRDPEVVKADMGSDLFNYVASNCDYVE